MNDKSNKKPFALLVNDIHAGKDNLGEFKKNWEEAVSVARDYSVEYIIVGGDLWQSRASQSLDTLMAVSNAMDYAVKQVGSVVLASGNHDRVNQEDTTSYNHIFECMRRVNVVDSYVSMNVGEGVVLWVMCYFPENGSFTERLKLISDNLNPKDYNILYCHEGISGYLPNGGGKELPVSIFKKFDRVLAGHYHDRGAINGTKIEYIGASRQHNFGEDENKGYTVLYSDGSTKFVQNKANIRYRTIELGVADTAKAKTAIDKAVTEGCRVRVKVVCTEEEATKIDKQSLLDMGASKVEIKATSQTFQTCANQLEVRYDKEAIKNEYTTYCKSKGIEDVKIGMRYLDKIN